MLIGVSLVLITEYFEVKGAKILRLGYMTTLIYGGIILASGYKFIYGNNGILTGFLAKIFPAFPTDWFHGYWAVLFVMTFACTSNHMIFFAECNAGSRFSDSGGCSEYGSIHDAYSV